MVVGRDVARWLNASSAIGSPPAFLNILLILVISGFDNILFVVSRRAARIRAMQCADTSVHPAGTPGIA
jgi:hypothetical protein